MAAAPGLRAGMISFKGHGRGAATMTTLDASRLLIAAAGSSFAKDSVQTLKEFGSLQPLAADNPVRGASVVERPSRITFEKYLTEMMQRLIDEKEQLSSCLPSPTPRSTTGSTTSSVRSSKAHGSPATSCPLSGR